MPTATPTPIPAFAPVERSSLCGDGAADWEPVAFGVDVLGEVPGVRVAAVEPAKAPVATADV